MNVGMDSLFVEEAVIFAIRGAVEGMHLASQIGGWKGMAIGNMTVLTAMAATKFATSLLMTAFRHWGRPNLDCKECEITVRSYSQLATVLTGPYLAVKALQLVGFEVEPMMSYSPLMASVGVVVTAVGCLDARRVSTLDRKAIVQQNHLKTQNGR